MYDGRRRSGIRHAARWAGLLFAAGVASGAAAQGLSTEQRLDQLESESEIRYLLDRYMDLLGAADWDNYVLMFAEDGELVMDEGTRRGREDIKERMAGATARMARGRGNAPRRQSASVLSNIRVQVHGDAAQARSRFTQLGESPDGTFHVTGSGMYLDEWVRVGGNWLIKRRTVAWDMLRGAGGAGAAAAPSPAAP